jgi:hypothetical protein
LGGYNLIIPLPPADIRDMTPVAKITAILTLLLLPLSLLFPDQLELLPEDIRIEQSREGGYNLYVRKKEGLGSILITESTVDPEKKESNYALRNPEWHPVNGDEKRILNGEFLNAQEQGRYFLISSTVKDIPGFGPAFHIFIPYVVEYGYPWSRSGEMYIAGNSWINIRTFEKPYADYDGPFRDNPFVLRVIQPTPEERTPVTDEEPLPEEYMPAAVEAFEEIAEEAKGDFLYVEDEEELVEKIREIVSEISDGPLDLVICIDTTGSMKESIENVQKGLVPMLLRDAQKHKPLRVGAVLFRDYFEEYVTKELPFQENLSAVQNFVNRARSFGGGDIPEAVYEALNTALTRLEWRQKNRTIILIGDAPPHPRPRGKTDRETVFEKAEELGVAIHAILLPHP